jgi:hypothetical protein
MHLLATRKTAEGKKKRMSAKMFLFNILKEFPYSAFL